MEDLPTDYDAIVVGTGLVESIYAAAAARIGKSVLHIDRNGYYSGQWAVLNFKGLQEWVDKHSAESSNDASGAPAEGEPGSLAFHPVSLINNVTQRWFIDEGEADDAAPSAPGVPPVSAPQTEAETTGATSSGNESLPTTTPPPPEGAPAPSPLPVEDCEHPPEAQPPAAHEAAESPVGQGPEATSAADPGVSTTTPEQARLPTSEKREANWTISQMRKLSRRFNIDLAPKVLYSRGALVELLISSNIARYAEFRAVGQLLTPLQDQLQPVPSSRADVFTTRHVSVVEKRLLMKLLTFCAEFDKSPEQYQEYEQKPFSEFLRSRRLTDNLTHHVIHAIAMVTPQTPTLEALQSTQKFLRSLGRYGTTPFLWPMYGSGELPQCFCRMCAVFGGVYCLSRGVEAVTVDDSGACSGVISEGQRLTCRRLLLEAAYGPAAASAASGVSRAIVFTDRSLYPSAGDQILLIRLPAEGSCAAPVTVLQAGSAASAVPAGLYVVHLTCRQSGSAEEDLAPAVSRLQALAASSPEGSGGSPPPLQVLGVVYFNGRGPAGDDSSGQLPANVSVCDGPDETFDFERAVQQARALFVAHFPGEEFLPRAPDPEEIIFFDEPSDSVVTGGAQPLESGQSTTAAEGSAGDGSAVAGDGSTVPGDGSAVAGDGSAVAGDGSAVAGDEGAAVECPPGSAPPPAGAGSGDAGPAPVDTPTAPAEESAADGPPSSDTLSSQ